MTTYPQSADYQEALQHPRFAFTDPELQRALVRQDGNGIPLPMSGGFALTYSAQVQSRRYAVRCFKRHIPAIEHKYHSISQTIMRLNSSYFVNFRFQRDGIRIKQQVYPIVVIDWVEGDTLTSFLDSNYSKSQEIRQLCQKFRDLAAFLEYHKIGHGDISTSNVMILPNKQLKLIDYDGMWVPDSGRGMDGEVGGHRFFQHPKRTPADFGPGIDRFSFIAIDISLRAIAEDPSLYLKYRNSGETIIFNANDFAAPSRSEILKALLNRSSLAGEIHRFIALCETTVDRIPSLDEFLRGWSDLTLPNALPKESLKHIETSNQATIGYISAYRVVDATDYIRAKNAVGDRAEVIGKIVNVKHDRAINGQPYIFIEFGDWRRDIVKVVIWSEGVSRISDPPSKAWEGRWVSVTGLVCPPFVNPRFSYSHVQVLVSDTGQMQLIDEREARYRLQSVNSAPAVGGTSIRRSSAPPVTRSANGPGPLSANREVLDRIASRSQPAETKPVAPSPALQTNQDILDRIRTQRTQQPSPISVTPPVAPSSQPRLTPSPLEAPHNLHAEPGVSAHDWIWWAVAILALAILLLMGRALF